MLAYRILLDIKAQYDDKFRRLYNSDVKDESHCCELRCDID